MRLGHLERWFNALVLGSNFGQKCWARLSDWGALSERRTARCRATGVDRIGGGVLRPNRRSRCIPAMAAIREDWFSVWRGSRAILVWF